MVMRLARGNTECNAVFPVMSVQTVSQQLLELEKALPGPVPAILRAAAVPFHMGAPTDVLEAGPPQNSSGEGGSRLVGSR